RSEGYLWDKTQEWRNPDHPFGYPCYHYHRAEYASNMARVLFNPETLALTDDDSPLGVMKRSFCADAMQRLHPLNATRLVTFNQLYGVIIPTLGDRVEMANSLECRTPFMDRRMLELAGTIPPEYFLDIDRLHGKHLLRTAFRELLPDSFHKEHKHPFLSPRWSTFAKTKAGAELFEDALSPETIRRAGIFHPYAVDRAQHAWRRPDLRPQKAKQVDTMIGMIMSVHVLFKLFVEHPIACDPEFTMADRSPA
ncbi:MAG: asparagine synthase C-terminal domain-containing protein, partial [Planctomycetota bacterium]|nr:asparagine synthase C-terminal domain-containing protein [Planctomycetota bacterium]